MAAGFASSFVFCIIDHLLRRWLLPSSLLAASLIRYNLFSFIYLLLFIVGVVIPSPRLKKQRAMSGVYSISVVILSFLFTIAQVGYQIAIATGFKLDKCDDKEIILRQIGLILFVDMNPLDIVRQLLPDVIVLAIASITTGICIKVATIKLEKENVTDNNVPPSTTNTEPLPSLLTSDEGLESFSPVQQDDAVPSEMPQEHVKLPAWVPVIFDMLIFFTCLLCGSIVPSLTSFCYYVIFLIQMLLWCFHLKLAVVVRSIRFFLLAYACLHMSVVYLYQFQSFQLILPVSSMDDTRDDRLVKSLVGLTPIIKTDCLNPTQLHVWDDTPPEYYVYPLSLIVLLWILGIESQLWLSTPRNYWTSYQTYFIPTLPFLGGAVFKEKNDINDNRAAVKYGATGDTPEATPTKVVETGLSLEATQDEDIETVRSQQSTPAPLNAKAINRETLRYVWNKFMKYAAEFASLVMSVNYVFSLIAMMAWSVVYPTWLAFVLLLWACTIWLIPRVHPSKSFYYTSPILLLYSISLVLIQYVFSLRVLDNHNEVAISVNCTDSSSPSRCRFSTLAFEGLFMVVFCASVYEFFKHLKSSLEEREAHRPRTNTELLQLQGDQRLVAVSEEEFESRTAAFDWLYKYLQKVFMDYWALAIVMAFLLVILAGNPSILKSVYIVFLFIFLTTYQIFKSWWVYINYPLWWILIAYTTLHLMAVYTFPFPQINSLWHSVYNDFNISDAPSQDFFHSIGLIQYRSFSEGFSDSTSLFAVLIPLAILIAVLALQLRYFTFKPHHEQQTADITTIITQLTSNRRRSLVDTKSGSTSSSNGASTSVSATMEGEEVTKKKLTFYQVLNFVFVKLKQLVVFLWYVFWRFSTLHCHKAAMLLLFGIGLHEVSISFLVVVVFVLAAAPFPVLNLFSYPLVTIYLGVITFGKFIFQIDLVNTFNFNGPSHNSCNGSSPPSPPPSYFHYAFSPAANDSSWFGLSKSENSAIYVVGPLMCSLLLSFFFTAKRYQDQYFQSANIHVRRWEVGSLFLGIDNNQIDRSVIVSIKYVINHAFEMYGVEICWMMYVILIGARIDVYGVIYGVILGAMLLLPKRVRPFFWMLVLLCQGLLIFFQYLMLLGLPPGLEEYSCHGYPWREVFYKYNGRLNKWLYLPYYGSDILDRSVLFADIVLYVLMCQQMKYYIVNPLYSMRRETATNYDMYNLTYLVDYFKVFLFQYFFYITLFVIFLTGAFHLNMFGLVYVITCFVLLYRGQSMLVDSLIIRIRWWSVVRFVVFLMIFSRSLLQIAGCVFNEFLMKKDDKPSNFCVAADLFDFECYRANYYNTPSPLCKSHDLITSTRLWADVAAFIIIIFQIILFNTTYADQVQAFIIKKEANASIFYQVMNDVLMRKKEKIEQEQSAKLEKLERRTEQLQKSEGAVTHLLSVGTRLPPAYTFQSNVSRRYLMSSSPTPSITQLSTPVKSKPQKLSMQEDTPTKLKVTPTQVEATPTDIAVPPVTVDEEDTPTIFDDAVHVMSSDVKKADEELGRLKKVAIYLWWLWLDIVDNVILWLEESSSDYTNVIYQMRLARSDEGRPLEEEEDEGREEEVGEINEVVPDDVEGGVMYDEDKDYRAIPEYVDDVDDVANKLGELSSDYTKRPRRLFMALYYFILSRFDFVVFFFVVIVILTTGGVTGILYAALLFLWGLLSIPWPSKRFWLTLMFFTMVIILVKYVAYFALMTTDTGEFGEFLGYSDGVFAWLFGIQLRTSYFANSIANLLLLLAIVFQRELMKEYGLWHSTSVLKRDNNFIKASFNSVLKFFRNLLRSSEVLGQTDYYIFMLTCDVFCFITIALGYSQFTPSAVANDLLPEVATIIQTNEIPIPFLAMLLAQFISMLIDRAIYLRRSIRAKFIYYIISLAAWHVTLLILLPAINDKAFVQNPATQAFYFFKGGYFVFSALQMISGYPMRLLDIFVSRSYNTVVGLIFMGYRLIPLIPELREVMGWVFTDTSLSLVNWLRVQEIWAILYKIKVQREREKTFGRDLGEKQSFAIKFLLGALLLGGLVLLIWGPLLFISFLNETAQPNPVIGASIELNIEGYKLLTIDSQSSLIQNLSDNQYEDLRRKINSDSIKREFESLFARNTFQRVLFVGDASLLWQASEPTRHQLIELLSNRDYFTVQFIWTFDRAPTTLLSSNSVSGSRIQNISDPVILEQLLDNLRGSSYPNINLTRLYPLYVTAPSNEISTEYLTLTNFITEHDTTVNCTTRLNVTTLDDLDINRWWTLTRTSPLQFETDTDPSNALEMIVYSQRVTPPALSFISSQDLSILGLYTAVVFVISKFIRSYINGLAFNLTVEEMLYPDRLLKLCDDIFTVREVKNFVLEEILVGHLIYIFRTPQRLLELSELPKEKPD